MKETPILFSVPMVRAILDGRKTQTRRIVKPQIQDPAAPMSFSAYETENGVFGFENEYGVWRCPYGKPGDLLYVRESFWHIEGTSAYAFLAGGYPDDWDFGAAIKRPSIHMPKNIARIWLEVVSVRVERLQEIKPSDCEAEGICGKTLATPVRGQPYEEYTNGDGLVYTTPKDAFMELWNSINGKKHPWSNNDWVWVIEFKQRKEIQ